MKLGYYSTSDPDILSIAEEVEYDLFTTILRNPQHVLQVYNHTYKNDLNCTISSEIVLDLANH